MDETRPKTQTGTESSPAGPHETPDLTDPEKTPGTGSLPDAPGAGGPAETGDDEADVGPD